MPQPDNLICPDCGAEMNHHAVTINYGIEDENIVDPVFGGSLKEAHCCPECGRTELKAA